MIETNSLLMSKEIIRLSLPCLFERANYLAFQLIITKIFIMTVMPVVAPPKLS